MFTWMDLEADPAGAEIPRAFRPGQRRHAGGRLRPQGAAAQSDRTGNWPRSSARGNLWTRPFTTWSWWAPDRPGWRRRSTGPRRGCNTLVLERLAPGGQAGSSMRIENYLGFPMGLTGSELAERAMVQANKFGASPARGRTGHAADV